MSCAYDTEHTRAVYSSPAAAPTGAPPGQTQNPQNSAPQAHFFLPFFLPFFGLFERPRLGSATSASASPSAASSPPPLGLLEPFLLAPLPFLPFLGDLEADLLPPLPPFLGVLERPRPPPSPLAPFLPPPLPFLPFLLLPFFFLPPFSPDRASRWAFSSKCMATRSCACLSASPDSPKPSSENISHPMSCVAASAETSSFSTAAAERVMRCLKSSFAPVICTFCEKRNSDLASASARFSAWCSRRSSTPSRVSLSSCSASSARLLSCCRKRCVSASCSCSAAMSAR
mmetsp:Transcript_35250/g.110986  ORF Transcript_35250/g.110986 Transcript_35250/m.110986 type:complete len:286 (+) Transcript_35250:504-1361(+)